MLFEAQAIRQSVGLGAAGAGLCAASLVGLICLATPLGERADWRLWPALALVFLATAGWVLHDRARKIFELAEQFEQAKLAALLAPAPQTVPPLPPPPVVVHEQAGPWDTPGVSHLGRELPRLSDAEKRARALALELLRDAIDHSELRGEAILLPPDHRMGWHNRAQDWQDAKDSLAPHLMSRQGGAGGGSTVVMGEYGNLGGLYSAVLAGELRPMVKEN